MVLTMLAIAVAMLVIDKHSKVREGDAALLYSLNASRVKTQRHIRFARVASVRCLSPSQSPSFLLPIILQHVVESMRHGM